jgi:hypothetical protein
MDGDKTMTMNRTLNDYLLFPPHKPYLLKGMFHIYLTIFISLFISN